MAARNVDPAARNMIRSPHREEILELEVEGARGGPKSPGYPLTQSQLPMSNTGGSSPLDPPLSSPTFGRSPGFPLGDIPTLNSNMMGVPLLEPPVPPTNMGLSPGISPNDWGPLNMAGLQLPLPQLPALNINQIFSPPSNSPFLTDPFTGPSSLATDPKADLLNSPQAVPLSLPSGGRVAGWQGGRVPQDLLMTLGTLEMLDVIL